MMAQNCEWISEIEPIGSPCKLYVAIREREQSRIILRVFLPEGLQG